MRVFLNSCWRTVGENLTIGQLFTTTNSWLDNLSCLSNIIGKFINATLINLFTHSPQWPFQTTTLLKLSIRRSYLFSLALGITLLLTKKIETIRGNVLNFLLPFLFSKFSPSTCSQDPIFCWFRKVMSSIIHSPFCTINFSFFQWSPLFSTEVCSNLTHLYFLWTYPVPLFSSILIFHLQPTSWKICCLHLLYLSIPLLLNQHALK